MGYVKGYAFASAEVHEVHKAAAERVKQMDLRGAVLGRRSLYGKNVYRLDPAKTATLSDLEKVVFADSGPSPFGGTVEGDTVTIWID